jgi:hypothetical protein
VGPPRHDHQAKAAVRRSEDRPADAAGIPAGVRVCRSREASGHGEAAGRARGTVTGSRASPCQVCLLFSVFCPLRGLRRARGLGAGNGERHRAIRTGRLHALLRLHLRPIDVVVDHGSRARPGLEAGFPLRCLQRLSLPNVATRRCGWRHNRSTRGSSTPVLSY